MENYYKLPVAVWENGNVPSLTVTVPVLSPVSHSMYRVLLRPPYRSEALVKPYRLTDSQFTYANHAFSTLWATPSRYTGFPSILAVAVKK